MADEAFLASSFAAYHGESKERGGSGLPSLPAPGSREEKSRYENCKMESSAAKLLPKMAEVGQNLFTSRSLYRDGPLGWDPASVTVSSCLISMIAGAAAWYAVPASWPLSVPSIAIALLTMVVIQRPLSTGYGIFYYLNLLCGVLIAAGNCLYLLMFTFVSDETFVKALSQGGLRAEDAQTALPAVRLLMITWISLTTFTTLVAVSALREMRRAAKLSLPQ